MRVLVVSAWPPWPLDDGARLVLHHHLRHLAPRHEVTLLAAGDRPDAPAAARDRELLPVIRRDFAAKTGPAAYVRRRIRSWRSGEPADVHRVESAALLDAFARELARRPDVVHLHGWGTAQLARRAGGAPTVHVAIDPWGSGLWVHSHVPRWRRTLESGQPQLVNRHERVHYLQCDRVVVVSDADAALLQRTIPGGRFVAVPNGVELGPEPPADRAAAVLGFHGALSTPANADAAIRLARQVLPRVRRRMPGATAVLIGRDPLPRVRALAGDHVTVTGAVDDIPAALAGVTVYVAPIDQGRGIRNKVLEAMAAGLPVVATPTAVLGIGEGDGIVVAETDDDLATAVAHLLDHDDEARALGRGGRARVATDFTWGRAADAIEAVWQELVDGPATAAHD
ncbi:MAG: glycosyl transferase group 1 family protein [Acidimicrobiales bacterium]|jgi:glycosyltransferase involved in cell wall biosynthesis|nr:glycosyl transferase group 1 family protein [Acidimicrobiales bacterium]